MGLFGRNYKKDVSWFCETMRCTDNGYFPELLLVTYALQPREEYLKSGAGITASFHRPVESRERVLFKEERDQLRNGYRVLATVKKEPVLELLIQGGGGSSPTYTSTSGKSEIVALEPLAEFNQRFGFEESVGGVAYLLSRIQGLVERELGGRTPLSKMGMKSNPLPRNLANVELKSRLGEEQIKTWCQVAGYTIFSGIIKKA